MRSDRRYERRLVAPPGDGRKRRDYGFRPATPFLFTEVILKKCSVSLRLALPQPCPAAIVFYTSVHCRDRVAGFTPGGAVAVEWRVRDPVHNFIPLREQQVELIGTRSVQRLRGIHQLALANLVYPGAVHTRFDHTLGVAHVAGLMARSLGFDEDRVALVQNAALLHDLGHGPFSHGI
jgi:HD domain